jgi:hypothetical protein
MEFASSEWMESFKDKCNSDQAFRRATEFADTKLVFMFGDKRYFWKIYKSRIIDSCPFVMSFDPLGYDVVVRGPMEVWESLKSKKSKFWDHYNNFQMEIGGNHMDGHRLHEAILVMCEDILPTV